MMKDMWSNVGTFVIRNYDVIFSTVIGFNLFHNFNLYDLVIKCSTLTINMIRNARWFGNGSIAVYTSTSYSPKKRTKSGQRNGFIPILFATRLIDLRRYRQSESDEQVPTPFFYRSWRKAIFHHIPEAFCFRRVRNLMTG